MGKDIIFSEHAIQKFQILKNHQFEIKPKTVTNAIRNPESISIGYKGRKIAQKSLDETHLIRVVFEERESYFKVITFYPARKERYESQL